MKKSIFLTCFLASVLSCSELQACPKNYYYRSHLYPNGTRRHMIVAILSSKTTRESGRLSEKIRKEGDKENKLILIKNGHFEDKKQ